MKLVSKLFYILPLIFMSHLLSAQDGFGVKAGLNLASINIDNAEATYDSRTGYHLGVFARAKSDKIGFQPELLLFTQRGKVTHTGIGTATERFTYLSIPLMLKFYPVGGLNIQMGPQFGILLDGERKVDDVFGTRTYDIKDSYKETDVSLSLGAGYDFPFGLGMDFRYNIGLQDINDAADGDKAKSRVFIVSLGWNFLAE
jgi:hypothetical protein